MGKKNGRYVDSDPGIADRGSGRAGSVNEEFNGGIPPSVFQGSMADGYEI